MQAKAVLLFCAQAFLAQCISSQCPRPGYTIPDGFPGPFTPWNTVITDATMTGPWPTTLAGLPPFIADVTGPWPATLAGLPYEIPVSSPFVPAASNGGGFRITSVSPIGVTGITMTSENVYEGPLAVSGAVPFLGTVALEGAVPSSGGAAVTYGCGNGNVVMLSENMPAARELGYGYPPLAFEAGMAGNGYPPLAFEAGMAGYGYPYNRGCGCGAL